MSNNKNSRPPYEILSREELDKIEIAKEKEIKKSYILDYNGAFVTIFRDGSATVRPPVLGENEGLVFYDLDAMNEMIASRSYPVKGNDTFWEKEKERVLHFNDSMPYYCERLSEMLDFKVEFNHDAAYLAQLSEVATKALKGKTKKKDLLRAYLTIYIGELLRQKVNGKWRLLPHASLNVYYVPEITKGNQYCEHWNSVVRQLEMASFIPVNIEALIERANEFYPIGNRKYADNIH